MKRIVATYQRVCPATARNVGEPLTISADVLQDCAESCLSELCIVWTDETLALLASLELGTDELAGCEEAVESAFWSAEEEACRVASVRQRTSSEAA
jgi:hypothetical protein